MIAAFPQCLRRRAHRRGLALALLLSTGQLAAPAAEPTAAPAPAAVEVAPGDLGRGLQYLAATSLATPGFTTDAPALVLDLRLAVDDSLAPQVRTLLATRDAARPVFVLIGAETNEVLRTLIPSGRPGVLRLASRQAGVAADVAVAVDPARDRAAAEALATGQPARELVAERIEKPRFDEERLARNHANGRREPEAEAATPQESETTASAEAPTPLRDLLLQRAVFIHRGLLALDRIPEHT